MTFKKTALSWWCALSEKEKMLYIYKHLNKNKPFQILLNEEIEFIFNKEIKRIKFPIN